ncbi:reverse transcriptase domain-containing protein [Tanacetum coccineum]
MRTRNSNFPNNSNVTIPRRRNRGRAPNVVEPELRTIVEVAPMAERTMEELLRAPTEGYGEAIVLPEINADHFEIKTNLLQLVQANPFHGYERENPHAHINSFKRITSTLRFRDVPNDVIKLMMFPYSLEGNARLWMNTTSRESVSKTDERIDKLADQISTLVEIVSKKLSLFAPVKAVEETLRYLWWWPMLASTSGTLPSNTIPNPKGEMKAITTRSGVAYDGPSIPTNPYSKKVVERETEETTDKEQSNFEGSTAQIPSLVNPIPIPEPDVPKSLPKLNIPYPSRRNDQKSHDKASNQMEKIFQIFQDLRFNISFADALLLMPRFAPTIKSLLMNKDKLLELAKIPLNENCSAMLLKKLPEKLGDPGKFLIPCNFPGMDVCHALADLGASINLMPLSIWKKLSLPELTPTRMILETGRALIDVYGEEITLRVDNEAVTFNLNQTTRYSSTYDDTSINRIDVIDVACEEFSQEVLGFLNNSSGGNPTSSSDPILSSTTPSFTPFEGGDFILEELETFLQTPDE